MQAQSSVLSKPSPLINIAAVAVIVASLTAVGAIMGIIPSAHSEKQDPQRVGEVTKNTAVNDGREVRTAHQADGRMEVVAAPCASCGVIESVRAMQVQGDASGLGAVAGGVTGALVGSQFGNGRGSTALGVVGAAGGAYAGHNIEKNLRKRTSYRVTVRMEDGSARTLYQSAPPEFGVGEKVKVINGALVARS
jgi:outer membrane lipoprotein SlyB